MEGNILLLGYARVSTQEQNLDRQLDQLIEYGVDKRNIYQEKITGKRRNRPQLDRMLNDLQSGDIIIISDLTRISRSLIDLLYIVNEVIDRGASIKSIKETWLDTTSTNPQSSFLLAIFGGFSQFERDLISLRTKEGLAAARSRGRCGGRPKVSKDIIAAALKKYDDKSLSISEICKLYNISPGTLYNYINRRRKD